MTDNLPVRTDTPDVQYVLFVTARLDVLESRHYLLVDRIERDVISREKELAVALEAMNKRLESMNEFRRQIADSEARYAHKTDLTGVYARIDIIDTRVNLIKQGLDERILAMEHAFETRVHSLEKMIYMAMGAVALLSFALNLWKK